MRAWLAAALLVLPTAAQAQATERATAERAARFAAARAALERWTSPALTPFASEADIRAYFEAAREARFARPRDDANEQEILLVEPRQGPLGPPPLRLPEPGVERGDIVRQAGRFLLVLRRGRLHSIDIRAGRGGGLALADRVDPGGPMSSIHDNLLVRGEHVLVVGLTRAGGLLSVLRLGSDGRLTREGIFLFSASADYQAALAGDNLVLYGSTDMPYWGGSDPEFGWPSLRRWDQAAAERRAPPVLDETGEPVADDGTREAGRAAGPPRPLVTPGEVYRPVQPTMNVELHIVSICPLAALAGSEGPRCRSTAFAAPVDGRLIHLTQTDAFVSAAPGEDDRAASACRAGEDIAGAARPLLFRVPLAGGPPRLLALPAAPLMGDSVGIRDGRVHVMLDGTGPSCNAAPAGLHALFSAPLAAFARAPGTSGAVREAPQTYGDVAAFAGSHFALFDPHHYASDEDRLALIPLDPAGGTSLIEIPHAIMRAEPALGGMVLVGEGDSPTLGLSFVSLDGTPRLASTARLDGLREGRGGAYLAAVARGAGGLIGLPAAGPQEQGADDPPLKIAYLALDRRGRLRPLGALTGRAPVDRICQPTCRTWLDEGRAIFVDGRIFALADTMLIEARVAGGRIVEAGRLDLETARARSWR